MPAKSSLGPHAKSAFSLVELSIVLVILGLLTGGILTGQSLIRAAELRSITTEFQSYQTAVMTFKNKYLALPGDMSNATDFWGTMTSCGSAGTSGSGTETCNGNADGLLDAPSAASASGEAFTFWQHLVNAGLIEGSYTGIAGPDSILDHNASENSPQGAIGIWGARYLGDVTTTDYYYHMSYGNVMTVGASTSTFAEAALVSGPESWAIDKKVDDGLPAQGKLIARPTSTYALGIDCVISDGVTDFDSTYNLADETVRCSLIFRNIF